MNLATNARHMAAQFGTLTVRLTAFAKAAAVKKPDVTSVRLKPDTTYYHATYCHADPGYAMAALLVAMSVMAIVMSVAMPTWSHMIRREKEEELIFRGNQYARAIGQYQRKYASQSPPSLDILIEQKLLRKKYKDPLSPNEDGEFELLHVSSAGAAGQTGRQAGAGSLLGTKPTGAITGVASKNTGESIRVFNGKTHYNEWQFVAMQQSTQAGPADGTGREMQPPGRGSQQQQQPQRGR